MKRAYLNIGEIQHRVCPQCTAVFPLGNPVYTPNAARDNHTHVAPIPGRNISKGGTKMPNGPQMASAGCDGWILRRGVRDPAARPAAACQQMLGETVEEAAYSRLFRLIKERQPPEIRCQHLEPWMASRTTREEVVELVRLALEEIAQPFQDTPRGLCQRQASRSLRQKSSQRPRGNEAMSQ